jgi:hypothetical protein
MSTATKSPIHHLQWDADGKAVIETADGDRFVRDVADVVAIIQADEAKKAGETRVQSAVAALFSVLDEWISANRVHLESAWLTEHDHALLLLIVQKSDVYDAQLSSSLVELDRRLFDDANVQPIRIDTLAIPPWGDAPQNTFLSRRLGLRRKLD